jgi:hypothetical protein
MAVVLVVGDEEQVRVLVESILRDDLIGGAPEEALALSPTDPSTCYLPTSSLSRA